MGMKAFAMNTLTTLANSLIRLADGDFTTRSGLSDHPGEMGRVIRAFDLLAKNLEECEQERKHVHHALEASELRYRRLFETAQDGILILDAETGRVDDLNPCLIRLLGYPREQLVGQKIWETEPFRQVEGFHAAFKAMPGQDYIRHDDLSLKRSDGRRVSVEFVSNVYLMDEHKVVQCNLRDITKRKSVEKTRNEYSQRLETLSRRLVETQETERRRIARELHDEIGQALTAVQLNLQNMLHTPALQSAKASLAETLEAVDGVLEQARDIALNLRPSILDDLGLEPALRWYAKRQAAATGLKLEVSVEPLERRLDPVLETECFRVAQEALTNVARHANAKSVTVDVRTEDGQLHLRVRDDGVGFDVSSGREKATLGVSLGLLSKEERASLAGGKLEFKSAPGQGTEVHAWFPLKWAEQTDSTVGDPPTRRVAVAA